jgi:UDP-N-acetylenolpyruvoylglucosamine reductase
MPETMTVSATEFADLLRKELSTASVVRANEPMAKRTTLRVGGPADVYVEPASEEDLSRTLQLVGREHLPLMFLGRGSNLLVRDGGIRGVVISLGHASFSFVRVEGADVHCGGGARLKKVAVEARNAGLGDLEFLEGIPGSVGGAMRMNAGAMGSAFFDRVVLFRYMQLDGTSQEAAPSTIEIGYRHCPFFKTHLALGAVLRGRPEARGRIEEKMAQCSQKRWTSQPAAPSAGCIFKNSPTVPSGRLVQELGLKGTRIGGAVVSDVHGNFIVNDGRATAREVLELIEVIKVRAREQRGIELETEVEIIGEDPS